MKSVKDSTGYWITRLARSMERDFEERLGPLGITRGAFAVLSAVHYDKKSKPAELAAYLGVDGAAVTRHLDRIEKKGLIRRVTNAKDRRSFDIILSAKGKRILEQGRSCSKATNDMFTTHLSDAEMSQLQTLVRTMLSESEETVTDI